MARLRARGGRAGAGHVLAGVVTRPAHRRGARQRIAQVAGVADFVHRWILGMAIEMTDSAIRRVHAAVRIGVTGQGLLRGYPGHGDHSQRQEETDKGAPGRDRQGSADDGCRAQSDYSRGPPG